MTRWRVDYLGKKGLHLGTVEAPDEKSAIEQAAKQFKHRPLDVHLGTRAGNFLLDSCPDFATTSS
jgi:hypothetical protein